MEFSVSKAVNNLRPTTSRLPYANYSSTPSRNVVIPGIGHTVKPPTSSRIVALSSNRQNGLHLSKQIEVDDDNVKKIEHLQSGAGVESADEELSPKLDQVLEHSKKHPRMIETGSITIEKTKPVKQKTKGDGPPVKKAKQNNLSVKHKFSFL